MMRFTLIYALLLSAMMLAVTASVATTSYAAQETADGNPETDAESTAAPEPDVEIDEVEAIGPVTLNPIVEVDGEFIRLSDIFENIDRKKDRAVLRAPKAGEESTLGAVWLWKLAKAYRIDWQPSSKFDVAVASRRSNVVSTDQISSAVRDALFRETGEDDLVQLYLDDANIAIHLPMNAEPSLRLDRFRFDAASNRFSAVLIAPATGRTLEKRPVTGRVQRMAEVAVPVRRLSKGHVVRKRDLEIVRYRADKLGQNVVADGSLVVGMAVRRTLPAGKPIRAGDVHPPILIKKGQRVTVVYNAANMLLTTQGRAMQDGAADEMIRVQNLKSLVVIDGVVAGSNRVEVRPVGAVALN